MTTEKNTIRAYEMAKERYATLGVDTEKAMDMLQHIALSLHCWQTDDVIGFENLGGSLTGGIQVTGNYPGRARTIDEVRADALKVMSLVPGKHRFSLHATYGDFQGKVVDRNEIEPAHFQSWMEWAKDNGLKLDFNSTSFSHPKSGNLTLANPDESIRYYSGTLVYDKQITIDQLPAGNIYLNLQDIGVTAKVTVNGQYAGGVWTPPYRLDISEWLHQGENQISVEVTTTWQNRLIGDSRLPEQERTTWTACNGWSEKDPLQKSGLIGPVTLEVVKRE